MKKVAIVCTGAICLTYSQIKVPKSLCIQLVECKAPQPRPAHFSPLSPTPICQSLSKLEVRVVIPIRDDNIVILHVEVLWLGVRVVVLRANPLLSRVDKVQIEAVVLVCSKVGSLCTGSNSIAVRAVSA